jgi:hypothetical protein
VLVRLRFVLAIAVATSLALAWPTLRARWDLMLVAPSSGEQAVALW